VPKKKPSLPVEADGISTKKPTSPAKKQAVSINVATTSREVVASVPSLEDATVEHPETPANKPASKKKQPSANTELVQQPNRLPSDLPENKASNTGPTKLQRNSTIRMETQELTPPTSNSNKQVILSTLMQSMAAVSQLLSPGPAHTAQKASSPTPTGNLISTTNPFHPIETVPAVLEGSSTNPSRDMQLPTNNPDPAQPTVTPANPFTSPASAH
jgi:hypothetical protein